MPTAGQGEKVSHLHCRSRVPTRPPHPGVPARSKKQQPRKPARAAPECVGPRGWGRPGRGQQAGIARAPVLLIHRGLLALFPDTPPRKAGPASSRGARAAGASAPAGGAWQAARIQPPSHAAQSPDAGKEAAACHGPCFSRQDGAPGDGDSAPRWDRECVPHGSAAQGVCGRGSNLSTALTPRLPQSSHGARSPPASPFLPLRVPHALRAPLLASFSRGPMGKETGEARTLL